jgi:hypothetical protein
MEIEAREEPTKKPRANSANIFCHVCMRCHVVYMRWAGGVFNWSSINRRVTEPRLTAAWREYDGGIVEGRSSEEQKQRSKC